MSQSLVHRRPPDPGYVEVLCSACDPPSMVHVPKEWIISEPYICTCCMQRTLKRALRASEPLFGWMKHGEMREQEKR